MNKLILVFQVLLTLAFTLFGLQKVFLPIPDLIEFGMLWVADFPAWQVRTFGVLEFLAVLGINLPHVIKALPKILAPLAASGLALMMVGAVITHLRRDDPAASWIITGFFCVMSVALAARRYREMGKATSDAGAPNEMPVNA